MLKAQSTILGILGTFGILGISTRSFPLNNLHGNFHARICARSQLIIEGFHPFSEKISAIPCSIRDVHWHLNAYWIPCTDDTAERNPVSATRNSHSGCQKNVPFIECFFIQPLIPAFGISELIFEKRYNLWTLNLWTLNL